MKNLILSSILVSLPLLLGGCGVEEPVVEVKPVEAISETKPELEGVNSDELEERDGIAYLKGSDTPYTGKYFFFHDNWQKFEEGNFKDGKMDGLVVEWYENGQKKAEGNWKDGKQDGPITFWHENGQKWIEGNYKDGKQDGLWVSWHENGKKESERNFKDGNEEGMQVAWHENGKKQAEANFKEGEPISGKFWNSKGEPVDTYEEAKAE